jgi:two-component system chemotaxis response regulator CheB
MPGVVMVQHMPIGFTKMFADRLNSLCEMEVREAEDGDQIVPGRILLAPGAKHLKVFKRGSAFHVKIFDGELVNGHKPSVEVMMQSVAEAYGKNAIGVMLTGMGGDGADGMKSMHDAGARTIAQDEESCVVFGMPKVAWEKGGVDKLMPLTNIADEVIRLVDGI